MNRNIVTVLGNHYDLDKLESVKQLVETIGSVGKRDTKTAVAEILEHFGVADYDLIWKGTK